MFQFQINLFKFWILIIIQFDFILKYLKYFQIILYYYFINETNQVKLILF